MDNVTQQNASLVEEAAAASEALQSQAAKLAELVSVFRVDDRTPATASRVTVRAEPVMTALAAPAVKPTAKPTVKPAAIKPNTAARPVPVAKAAPARASAKAPAGTATDDWEEF
jgi:methyl-accepting chemotaxis protein